MILKGELLKERLSKISRSQQEDIRPDSQSEAEPRIANTVAVHQEFKVKHDMHKTTTP